MKNLSRVEMRKISGGKLPSFEHACPPDDCSSDSQCKAKPNSYCANTSCSPSPGYWSSFNSCQYVQN